MRRTYRPLVYPSYYYVHLSSLAIRKEHNQTQQAQKVCCQNLRMCWTALSYYFLNFWICERITLGNFVLVPCFTLSCRLTAELSDYVNLSTLLLFLANAQWKCLLLGSYSSALLRCFAFQKNYSSFSVTEVCQNQRQIQSFQEFVRLVFRAEAGRPCAQVKDERSCSKILRS